jgi:hypothetical protein
MKKFLYSASLIYLFLYMFPFPFMTTFGKVLDPIVFFVGNTVLNIKIPDQFHIYAVDTTYEYVKVLTVFLASLLLTIILQTAFSKRVKFDFIHDNTVLYARYFVGLVMINYGITKLCSAQFSMPSYNKLESTFGESSPMGLLWAFMGASKPYYIFVGFLEIFSGSLILFKRTKLLGSLLTLTIMLCVTMMNLCYDVPAKIFSIHLLILLVLIGARELKMVYSFFILHQPAQLQTIQKEEGKYRFARSIFKGLFIGGFILFSAYNYLQYTFTMGPYAGKNKIDGVYKTELFVIENDTLAPLTTDSIRWKSMTIFRGISKVTKMTDSAEIFNVATDSLSRTITFSLENQADQNYKLNYHEDKGKFEVTGLWKGKKIIALFTKKTFDDYPLINRGFHWINEVAYMR